MRESDSPHDALALPPVPPPAPESHRRYDRVVALTFAFAVAVPGLALFLTAGRTTTEFEKRNAAPWPPITFDSHGGFTAAFERAFADRFGVRDFLIRLHHTALAVVFRTSPVSSVIIGRDGWLFFRGENGGGFDRDFRRSVPQPIKETVAIASGITQRVRFLAAVGSDYLLVIVPDKYTIYPDRVPRALQPLSDRSPLDSLLEILPDDVHEHVLDLRPALLAARGERDLYFKTDTHWNANGAWIGYQQILAGLRHDRKGDTIQPLPRERPNGIMSGDLAYMLGVPSHFVNPRPALAIAPIKERCARDAAGEPAVFGAPAQTLYCPSGAFGTAMGFTDSMAIPLVPLLANDFHESHWKQALKWDLGKIAAVKPDIVIDEVVERNLPLIADVSFLDPANATPEPKLSAVRKWGIGYPPGVPEHARETQSCALDQVNGVPPTGEFEIPARGTLDMQGWAGDTASGALVRSAWMVLRDGVQILHMPVEAGRERPDVAAATGKPTLMIAGYRVVASADQIPAGTYKASIIWVDRNGWMKCDLRRALKVRVREGPAVVTSIVPSRNQPKASSPR